jgi:hypothetical protein
MRSREGTKTAKAGFWMFFIGFGRFPAVETKN